MRSRVQENIHKLQILTDNKLENKILIKNNSIQQLVCRVYMCDYAGCCKIISPPLSDPRVVHQENHVVRFYRHTLAQFTHLPSVLISSWLRAGSLDYPVAIDGTTCHVSKKRTSAQWVEPPLTNSIQRNRQLTRRSDSFSPTGFSQHSVTHNKRAR